MTIINTKGLPIRTKTERIIASKIFSPALARDRPLPSEIKNRIIKKSLSGRSLDDTSWAYGRADSDIPANSAPISIEKPICKNIEATPKPQPIANKNNSS